MFRDLNLTQAKAIMASAPAYAAGYTPDEKAVWLLIEELQKRIAKQDEEIAILRDSLPNGLNLRLTRIESRIYSPAVAPKQAEDEVVF